jgi:hypothetical protein
LRKFWENDSIRRFVGEKNKNRPNHRRESGMFFKTNKIAGPFGRFDFRSKEEIESGSFSKKKLGGINTSSIPGKFAIEFVFVRIENSEEIVGKQIFEELFLNDGRRYLSSKSTSSEKTALLNLN